VAKIKYDVSDVEAGGGGDQPQPGLYKAKVVQALHRTERKDGSPANDIELVLDIGEDYARQWTYIGLEKPSAWKLRELTDALGLPEKGDLDPTKLIGKKLQVKINSDQYEGNYRPRVGTLMKLGAGSDDNDDGEEQQDDDYDEWELDELKAEVEERELEVSGRRTKDKLISALRDADAGGEQEEKKEATDDSEPEDDYDEWETEELQAEVKERALEIKGRKTKDKMIAALREDDKENPF
jgi:hypothetical protein